MAREAKKGGTKLGTVLFVLWMLFAAWFFWQMHEHGARFLGLF